MERRSNSGSRGFGPRPPVKVGDVLDVEIEAVGEKGDGIARKDGFVLFVPGVKEGDSVQVKVTRVLRKVGFAEVVGDKGAEEAPAEQEVPVAEPEAPAPEEPVPETPPEDTEDFGEEVTEEASVEETVEEKPPEEPEHPSDEAADEIEAPQPPEAEEKTE